MIAFLIWSCCGIFFFSIGLYSFIAKKPVGFWANDCAPIMVTDMKKYNAAVGKLWIGFSFYFMILGLPFLLCPQRKAVLLLSILMLFFGILGMMLIYLRIEDKYRINK